MKKLLIHMGIAVTLLVAFELHVRSLQNEYVLKGEYFSQAADTTETLILGSSVALRGLDPEEVGFKAFSYAFQGQSHDVDFAILSNVISDVPNLERIVISVSSLSLKNDLSNSIDPFRASHYCLFTDFDVDVPYWHHLAATNFLYCRDMAKNAFFDPTSIAKFRANGFSPFQTVWDSTRFSKNVLKEKHSDWSKKAALPESLGLSNLSRLIKLCSERGIQVFLMETPIAPSLKEHTGSTAIDKQLMKHLTAEAGVTYIGVPAAYFSDRDFYDPTHLNINGALKWSRLAREAIQTYGPE